MNSIVENKPTVSQVETRTAANQAEQEITSSTEVTKNWSNIFRAVTNAVVRQGETDPVKLGNMILKLREAKNSESGWDVVKEQAEWIVKTLRGGVIPWAHTFLDNAPRATWVGEENGGLVILSKPMTHINRIYFGDKARVHHYKSNLWLAYDDIAKLGGKIKQGESHSKFLRMKAITVDVTPEDRDTIHEDNRRYERQEVIHIPIYLQLFNWDQCVNMPAHPEIEPDIPIPAEELLGTLPSEPGYQHNGACYYDVDSDLINMPCLAAFMDEEAFFGMKAKFLAISTGSPSRLNREGFRDRAKRGGANSYDQDTLQAEIAASMLCQRAGIKDYPVRNGEHHAQKWAFEIERNPRLLTDAGLNAQRSVSYLLGENTTPINVPTEDESKPTEDEDMDATVGPFDSRERPEQVTG